MAFAAQPGLADQLGAWFGDSPVRVSGDDAEPDPLASLWLPGDSLAPFVVTPWPNVLAALQLAGVCERDSLLDVGCGDGRVVVAAAVLCGAAATGLELEPNVAADAEAAVERWAAETVRPSSAA